MRARLLLTAALVTCSVLAGSGRALPLNSTDAVRVAAEITLPQAFEGEYATLVWDSANATGCELDLPPGYTTVGVDRDTSGALQVGPIVESATLGVICDDIRTDVPVTVVPRKRLKLDGVFDIGCLYSHTLPDDPIQHHGDPGASHLHDFLGNKTTDAFSTFDTLLDALIADPTNTTCSEKGRKQTKLARNASAYWAPIVLRNGERFPLDHLHLYYFSETDALTRPFAPGFQMIASEGHAKIWCDSPGHWARDKMPGACEGHQFFHLEVRFPNCWDGTLAEDGESHVTYGKRGCPGKFPYSIPRLLMELYYGSTDGEPIHVDDDWQLSSGPLTTAHADELNAWDPFRLDFLVHECSNREAKCKGDPPGDFTGPVHQVKA